jgi:homoserine kinase
MMGLESAEAFAPASIGNVVVGFDVLGLCLEAPGDKVKVRKIPQTEVRIVEITGCVTDLPLRPEENTAGQALLSLVKGRALQHGFEVYIHKGIPLGSGMGGSASSAVAAIVAANSLLELPLRQSEALHFAVMGEAVASGAPHADNVAPCMLGGLLLVSGDAHPRACPIPVPPGVRSVLVRPDLRLDTKKSRSVLKRPFELPAIVEQSSNLAHFIAACFRGDQKELGRSMRDVLIEPHRAALIPGFEAVQSAAMSAGALGCSIAGGGPSMMAWVPTSQGEAVKNAMVQAFQRHASLDAHGFVSRLDARGARLLEAS